MVSLGVGKVKVSVPSEAMYLSPEVVVCTWSSLEGSMEHSLSPVTSGTMIYGAGKAAAAKEGPLVNDEDL